MLGCCCSASRAARTRALQAAASWDVTWPASLWLSASTPCASWQPGQHRGRSSAALAPLLPVEHRDPAIEALSVLQPGRHRRSAAVPHALTASSRGAQRLNSSWWMFRHFSVRPHALLCFNRRFYLPKRLLPLLYASIISWLCCRPVLSIGSPLLPSSGHAVCQS